MITEQETIRREKLSGLTESINAYPDKYETNYSLKEARSLDDGIDGIRVAGRILSVRKLGKLTFITISDIEAKLQLALKEDNAGKEQYAFFHEYFDIGDFIGAEGTSFTTNTGEKTVRILNLPYWASA